MRGCCPEAFALRYAPEEGLLVAGKKDEIDSEEYEHSRESGGAVKQVVRGRNEERSDAHHGVTPSTASAGTGKSPHPIHHQRLIRKEIPSPRKSGSRFFHCNRFFC